MKTVTYNWDDEIWLIQVEAGNNGKDSAILSYYRVMDYSENTDEETMCIRPAEVRRFIVSRKGIKETGVTFKFEEHVELKIYMLLDRAYLPTTEDMYRAQKD